MAVPISEDCLDHGGTMGLYAKILGTPFVYNRVRPFFVGGIDMSPIYGRLQLKKGDTVLDIGCGTGDALRYLKEFDAYVGFDTDKVALGFAWERYGNRPEVKFECKRCEEADVRMLCPSHVIMAGLLHHLRDDEAAELLHTVQASGRLRRIVTQDIVYIPGEFMNNLFARLDRGRYCRDSRAYESLAKAAGLQILESARIRSDPIRGRAIYHVMVLEPRGAIS